MGLDKRTIRLGGECLIERTIRIVTEATGRSPIIVGDNLAALPTGHRELLPDDKPGLGPIGSLIAAP